MPESKVGRRCSPCDQSLQSVRPKQTTCAILWERLELRKLRMFSYENGSAASSSSGARLSSAFRVLARGLVVGRGQYRNGGQY
jgi:hypothetical protein